MPADPLYQYLGEAMYVRQHASPAAQFAYRVFCAARLRQCDARLTFASYQEDMRRQDEVGATLGRHAPGATLLSDAALADGIAEMHRLRARYQVERPPQRTRRAPRRQPVKT